MAWSNAVSLDPRRSDNMTVNLALWWLHITAFVSSNIKEQYAPLKEVASHLASELYIRVFLSRRLLKTCATIFLFDLASADLLLFLIRVLHLTTPTISTLWSIEHQIEA